VSSLRFMVFSTSMRRSGVMVIPVALPGTGPVSSCCWAELFSGSMVVGVEGEDSEEVSEFGVGRSWRDTVGGTSFIVSGERHNPVGCYTIHMETYPGVSAAGG
jgi:hypothetical protein